jgi:hypothetical protein
MKRRRRSVCHALSGQDLDGHFTVQACVASAIHLTTAPRAEQGEHFIGAEARSCLQGHNAAAHYARAEWRIDR